MYNAIDIIMINNISDKQKFDVKSNYKKFAFIYIRSKSAYKCKMIPYEAPNSKRIAS